MIFVAIIVHSCMVVGLAFSHTISTYHH